MPSPGTMQLMAGVLSLFAAQTGATRHSLGNVNLALEFEKKTQYVATPIEMELGDPPAIDASCAVGGKTTGIGAITKSCSDSDEWAQWGLSVSGNGLMAEAAAAGMLRALSQTGILEQLATISSVSGGSWFNTQFGFSEDYFNGVVNASTPIDTFYTSYQGKAMAGFGGATNPTWEAMITAMYNGFSTGLDVTPALNENRAGNKHADLLFCTTLNGASLLSDNSTVVQLSSTSGSNGTNAFYSNPAFWLVPTTGSASWSVPGVDLSAAMWTADFQSSTNASHVLPAPTVTKIGAMSSAANGITANPQLSALMTPQSQYSALFGEKYPGNGVCTTPGETCSFPSMMAIDGCYSDNLGFALNVGYLQKKFPGKKLRLMAVSSLICDRTADPTCIAGVNGSAFRSFFADSPYPTVEGWLPAVVPGPNRTIFAESLTDEQALGQQTGHGGMTFVTGTFTTVQNDHFGVAAGTKVSIIVLNVNGPQYLQPVGPGVPAGGVAGLSSVATNAYKSMNAILSALSTNQRVTSDSAFLYYQTVLNPPPAPAVTMEDIESEHRCCCEERKDCLWYSKDRQIHGGHCPRLWESESWVLGGRCISDDHCFFSSKCSQTHHSPGSCAVTTETSAYAVWPTCPEA
jgi:hypothetical protein